MKTEKQTVSHTPGPWSYSKCNCGHPCCHSYDISHSDSRGGFTEADAKLIAAAPDLLEWASAALTWLEDADGVGLILIDGLRSAIAKATR